MPKASWHKRRCPTTGEVVWARGAKLYSDWELLEVASRAPASNEDFVAGRWLKDDAKEAQAERDRRANMPRAQLIAWIEALEAQLNDTTTRLARLEKNAGAGR
jgi:hypothetical protein